MLQKRERSNREGANLIDALHRERLGQQAVRGDHVVDESLLVERQHSPGQFGRFLLAPAPAQRLIPGDQPLSQQSGQRSRILFYVRAVRIGSLPVLLGEYFGGEKMVKRVVVLARLFERRVPHREQSGVELGPFSGNLT